MSDETTPEPYRPCAGCDSVGESCRAARCPATPHSEAWGAVSLRGIAAHALARAESAEAALAGLRERVKALADEWAAVDAAKPYAMTHIGDCADDLTALLPTPDREEARDE